MACCVVIVITVLEEERIMALVQVMENIFEMLANHLDFEFVSKLETTMSSCCTPCHVEEILKKLVKLRDMVFLATQGSEVNVKVLDKLTEETENTKS